MLFNSIEFLLFFPAVVLIYFYTPQKYRWVLLLAASYYFYMCWKAEYIILIVVSTLIDYFAGLQLGKEKRQSRRKLYLIASLVSNLGILVAFKYFNFLSDSARTVFEQFNLFYDAPTFDLLLPVGISFYTFQSLSYTIDVYRGKKEPEKHFGIFALYISFFPQLVAGPIERSSRLLPQFHRNVNFDYQRVADGLKLMAWGFFKKLVIADRLAMIVNEVYGSPTEFAGVALLLATWFFAFQIYCDFSGYSDIAIGAAQVLGFDLMKNFNRPYFSKSIAEFWQRWHISLSTWFRDYLYIPLGGNRVVKWRWYYNLIVVFLISGLWHGANWTFVIWGGLHGFYLVFSIWTQDFRQRLTRFFKLDKAPFLKKALSVFTTFHLVVFAWIFFRANSVPDAFYIITHLFTGLGEIFMRLGELGQGKGVLGFHPHIGNYDLVIAFVSILVLASCHLLQRNRSLRAWLSSKPAPVKWPIYYAVIAAILLFGVFGAQEFIYFQF